MAELGLFALPFPQSVGGAGGDFLCYCLALEEIARADAAVAITLEAAVSLGISPIVSFGTPEQQERWLPELLAGDGSGRSGSPSRRPVRTPEAPGPAPFAAMVSGSSTAARCSSPTPARTSARA